MPTSIVFFVLRYLFKLESSSFQRKIFSQRFLVLFDAKKKEPIDGGEARQGRAVDKK